MRKSTAVLTIGLFAAAASAPAMAQDKADNELNESTQIMQELTGPQATAGIPDAVLKNAKCIAVIPKMLKAGFVVGGQHGSGVATCRLANGHWSPPAPFSLSGASFGLQIGGEEVGTLVAADEGPPITQGPVKYSSPVDQPHEKVQVVHRVEPHRDELLGHEEVAQIRA